ncbi:DUF2269 domain-containing protein [Kitasatospora viridis]|uniref:DUF2269 domain-containing protein n=1 Tax=Kitasatospora viridis TaxID=281105 RepID=A0A561UCD3_9ACTN|nr:DUF2269 domain-containing protein [Kitasatospora viridis]TWF97025.1 hypothetical protein FHX73_11800 [Kitasatospora viridis]
MTPSKTAEPSARGRTERPTVPLMPPTVRKTVTVLHVVSSVGWLGLMLCLLTLGANALLTDDADTLRFSYRAADLLGDALIIPLALLALLTGLLLALGTRWGLFKHTWVATKFWLTLVAAAASIFELRARLHEAAHVVATHPTGPISAMDLGSLRSTLVVAPVVALAIYAANVTLSVVKPWGRRDKAKAKAS